MVTEPWLMLWIIVAPAAALILDYARSRKSKSVMTETPRARGELAAQARS